MLLWIVIEVFARKRYTPLMGRNRATTVVTMMTQPQSSAIEGSDEMTMAAVAPSELATASRSRDKRNGADAPSGTSEEVRPMR